MRVRRYGDEGPFVAVLHGGPGAPGYMAPVARRLADAFRVLEPLQRGSGERPLTVARHVADLRELLETHCADKRPGIVGSSWGAMLALAYAAEHPQGTGPLVLIGCGTFDVDSRSRLNAICEARTDEQLTRRMDGLDAEFPDPDERLKALGEILLPIYSYELVTTDLEMENCDARAYDETWRDMVRLQESGVYPAAFAAIDVPVLMLHGAHDPHPGDLIRKSLERYLPQIEYLEWERCGHYPWLEKAVHEEFFGVLRSWLGRQLDPQVPVEEI